MLRKLLTTALMTLGYGAAFTFMYHTLLDSRCGDFRLDPEKWLLASVNSDEGDDDGLSERN